jgi:hypothetical protein
VIETGAQGRGRATLDPVVLREREDPRQYHATLASTSLTLSSTCAIPVMAGRTWLLNP